MSDCLRIGYSALSSDEAQIRTLILHAGSVHEPIRGSLRTISLAEEPVYDALSYVWGDASVTKPIQIEGVEFNATRNLERALRHLRDDSDDLTLWVDAGANFEAIYAVRRTLTFSCWWVVCINQNDIEEKSKQVAMMGRIYQQCHQVRIWLGCDETTCNLEQPLRKIDSTLDAWAEKQDPFEIVRFLANDEHISDWQCFSDGGSGLHPVYRASAAFEASWAGFRTIAKSTWWTRMWT